MLIIITKESLSLSIVLLVGGFIGLEFRRPTSTISRTLLFLSYSPTLFSRFPSHTDQVRTAVARTRSPPLRVVALRRCAFALSGPVAHRCCASLCTAVARLPSVTLARIAVERSTSVTLARIAVSNRSAYAPTADIQQYIHDRHRRKPA